MNTEPSITTNGANRLKVQPIGSCSAQNSVAALMLRHLERFIMERVLSDLEVHRDWWEAFVMGSELPPSGQADFSGWKSNINPGLSASSHWSRFATEE